MIVLFLLLIFQPETLDLPALQEFPQVHSVKSNEVEKTTHRIVHILNWHFVPQDVFAVDIRDQSEKPVSDDEIDELYEEFLSEVEAVQKEQMEVLRHLVKHNGLKKVYLEGLTAKDAKKLENFINTLRKHEPPKGDSGLEIFLREQYRRDLLELGAAGRLVISGELEAVLPVEDAELLEAANPVKEDGKVRFDQEAIERREDAMVKNMLKMDEAAVIILGGGHDLTDNSDNAIEYIRIESRNYHKLVLEMEK